jgi:hypothetical protein
MRRRARPGQRCKKYFERAAGLRDAARGPLCRLVGAPSLKSELLPDMVRAKRELIPIVVRGPQTRFVDRVRIFLSEKA